MASHTSNSFEDGELRATLPAATAVYDVEQSDEIPTGTPHVDWAWDEPPIHFLCELKDPESRWALEDVNGIDKMRLNLSVPSYQSRLARKAWETTVYHTPSKREPRIYVVVVAIASLDGAVLDAAGQIITGATTDLGNTIPTIVVNLARWNVRLAPRTLERAP